jgi:sugar phosphate isomerase/epimerase
VARIGLQLYTLREDAARDLEGTIARVGAAGYEGVELHAIDGAEPAEVRSWLDRANLTVAGWHAQLPAIEDDLDGLAELLAALGTTRLTLSWIEAPATSAGADDLAGRILAAARRVSERGLAFGFHNHAGEVRPLDDGRSFLDRLLDAPADLVALELDLGWIWDAGADPEQLLRRAAGRCPLVHVKDFAARDARAFVPVGDGSVGYERVLPAAIDAGAEWLLVEQDETDGPAFAAVERSLAAVRRMLGR